MNDRAVTQYRAHSSPWQWKPKTVFRWIRFLKMTRSFICLDQWISGFIRKLKSMAAILVWPLHVYTREKSHTLFQSCWNSIVVNSIVGQTIFLSNDEATSLFMVVGEWSLIRKQKAGLRTVSCTVIVFSSRIRVCR